MTLRIGFVLALLLCACATKPPEASRSVERIIVASNGRDFITEATGQLFHPWGMNYGNKGRLMEDFWDGDWQTLADDFAELKALGANVVRVHLQYGNFMASATEPNTNSLRQLRRLLKLAQENRIYLDVTGLACYRPSDIPAWYDAMEEAERWSAQARFWEVIAATCSGNPIVFCYDLINEPVSPGQKRAPGKWPSGNLFGGYDFLQYIALDPAGRKREDMAVAWIREMTAAIRKHDSRTMITVGLLPWSRDWKHLSGFLPEKVAPELDFISVHIYPDSKKPGEAMEGLEKFAVGKPVVIEETFPLSCPAPELEKFLLSSRRYATGWIGHYDGDTIAELDAKEKTGSLTIAQSIYRSWLELFVRLKAEMFNTQPGRL